MTSETRVSKTGSLSSVEVKGESVILNMESGTYFGLDGVGARVWALLDSPRRFGELCDTVVAEYEVDPTVAESDLTELIEDLEQKGLVEVSE